MPSETGAGLFPAEGVAVVIGGSGGIGAEICRVLAREGSDIALTYHNNVDRAAAAAAKVAAEGRKAPIHRLDIEQSEPVRAFVDRVAEESGGIHTLVYAAGPLVVLTHLSNTEPDVMRAHLLQDTLGFFNVVHAVIPHLRQSRGSLVACQTAAHFRYAAADGLSIVPKAGVNAIMKGVAKEEGRFGVRANGVAVGMVDAGQQLELVKRGLIDETYMAAAAANTPLGSVGKAVDVAEAVAFLASSRAAFVTGQVIAVDGGYSI